MNKEECLELVKLLSAIESWSFACQPMMPDYLSDKIADSVSSLCKEILNERHEPTK